MSKSFFAVIFAVAITATPLFAQTSTVKTSDDAIAQELIAQSIRSYPGNCPCPYNSASNGSSCGRRSAYSRGGGASPLCYRSDITPAMIERYRKSGSDR